MPKTLSDGRIEIEQGDTLYDIYGSDWKNLSGYSGDPTNLQIGTVLPGVTPQDPVSTISTDDGEEILDQTKKKFDTQYGFEDEEGLPTDDISEDAVKDLEEKEAADVEETKAGYTFEEAQEIWGKDFTGIRKGADGLYYPSSSAYERAGIKGLETDEDLYEEVDEMDQEIEEEFNKWQEYNVEEDPAFIAQNNAISSQYATLRRQMQQKNEARQRAIETMGYRHGTRQYAGAIQLGIEGEELSQAGARLTEIAQAEQAAKAAARIAFENNAYTRFSQKVDALQRLRENKAKALEAYNDALIAVNEKVENERKWLLDVWKFQQDQLEATQTTLTKEYDLAKTEGFEGSFVEYQALGEEIKAAADRSPKTIGNATSGYFMYNWETNGWDNIIAGDSTRTRTDLSPFEMLESRALSKELFGTRAGMKEENFGLVQDLMAGGLSADDIRDQLRYAGTSENFEQFRDVFNFITSGRGFSTDERERAEDALDEYLQDGDFEGARDYLVDQALGKASNDEYKNYAGRQNARVGVEQLRVKLQEYVAEGGKLGIISGKYEKILQKLGETKDPKLAKIANDVALLIQKYRQELTGAAFTESEAKEYESIFPGIDKTLELSEAKIDSLLEFYDRNDKILMERLLGGRGFEMLMGEDRLTQQDVYGYRTIDELLADKPDFVNFIISATNALTEAGEEATDENVLQFLQYKGLIENPNMSMGTGGGSLASMASETMTEIKDIPSDEYGGQCGRFVNKHTGLGVGDSYHSKLSKMDSSITDPQAGMVFVTPYKDTGHIGFVIGIEGNEAIVKDSNYNFDEKVRIHRIPINKITGLKWA